MPRYTRPKIAWGTGFVNTVNFGYPLDQALSFSVPRPGSVVVEMASGARDSWMAGHLQRLKGVWRWIPTADTADPVATGWDGATGVRAFLEWARAQNVFNFYPDKDVASFLACYLVEAAEPEMESDGTRAVQLVIQATETESAAFTGY